MDNYDSWKLSSPYENTEYQHQEAIEELEQLEDVISLMEEDGAEVPDHMYEARRDLRRSFNFEYGASDY